jgi:hypothetical protein
MTSLPAGTPSNLSSPAPTQRSPTSYVRAKFRWRCGILRSRLAWAPLTKARSVEIVVGESVVLSNPLPRRSYAALGIVPSCFRIILFIKRSYVMSAIPVSSLDAVARSGTCEPSHTDSLVIRSVQRFSSWAAIASGLFTSWKNTSPAWGTSVSQLST